MATNTTIIGNEAARAGASRWSQLRSDSGRAPRSSSRSGSVQTPHLVPRLLAAVEPLVETDGTGHAQRLLTFLPLEARWFGSPSWALVAILVPYRAAVLSKGTLC